MIGRSADPTQSGRGASGRTGRCPPPCPLSLPAPSTRPQTGAGEGGVFRGFGLDLRGVSSPPCFIGISFVSSSNMEEPSCAAASRLVIGVLEFGGKSWEWVAGVRRETVSLSTHAAKASFLESDLGRDVSCHVRPSRCHVSMGPARVSWTDRKSLPSVRHPRSPVSQLQRPVSSRLLTCTLGRLNRSTGPNSESS